MTFVFSNVRTLLCFLIFPAGCFSQTKPDLTAYDSSIPYAIEVIKNDDWVTENYFAVQKKGKWGAINEEGESVIPLSYDTLIPFAGNFSIGAKKGKFGLLSFHGDVLASFTYDSLYNDFSRHLIAIVDGKLGLLTDKGEEATPFVYSAITRQSTYGCRCAIKNGKLGMLSGAGKEVTPFAYDLLQAYEPPLDVWVLRKNGKWGFYDCEKQKELTPFIYDRVEKFYGYEAEVVERGVKKKVKLK